jgi:hypothetical protein
MKLAANIGLPEGSQQTLMTATPSDGLESFQHGSGIAFTHVQSVMIALDGSRLFNLLEECRLRYGRSAREQALTTFLRWREGRPALAGDLSGRPIDGPTNNLLSLLLRQLTLEEKLTLFRTIWQDWIASLPRIFVSVTIWRGDDLLVIARRLASSVRRVQETALPQDLLALQSWITGADKEAIGPLALGTEHRLAAHRLAAVLVKLATLARLQALASSQVAIKVQARLEVPTLTVSLRFQPCFWRDASLWDGHDSGRALLVRLQDMALRQDHGAGLQEFVTHVLGELTETENERLRSLATAEGLRTDSLLRELQILTLAARQDIEATRATVVRMQARKLRGKVVSEHRASCCTAKIEIRNYVCPLTRFAPFLG